MSKENGINEQAYRLLLPSKEVEERDNHAWLARYKAQQATQRVQSELDWESALAKLECAVEYAERISCLPAGPTRDMLIDAALSTVTNRRTALRNATRDYAKWHGGVA